MIGWDNKSLIVWIVFALLIGVCVGHQLGFREAKREIIPLYKAEIERLEKWNDFLIKSCLPYEIKPRPSPHNKGDYLRSEAK